MAAMHLTEIGKLENVNAPQPLEFTANANLDAGITDPTEDRFVVRADHLSEAEHHVESAANHDVLMAVSLERHGLDIGFLSA